MNRKRGSRRIRKRIEEHLKMDTGDFRSTRLVHHCKLGCCVNSYHSKVKFWQVVQDTLFSLMIGIPKESHWLELSEPALLLLLWFLCHRFPIRALRLAQGSLKNEKAIQFPFLILCLVFRKSPSLPPAAPSSQGVGVGEALP